MNHYWVPKLWHRTVCGMVPQGRRTTVDVAEVTCKRCLNTGKVKLIQRIMSTPVIGKPG